MSKTLVDQFREFVASNPTAAKLIDNIIERENGFTYTWDGVMDCHLIEIDGKLWDIQDRLWKNIDTLNLHVYYLFYPTMEAFIEKMKVECSDWEEE